MLDIASNISLLPHTHYLSNSFIEQYIENIFFLLSKYFVFLSRFWTYIRGYLRILTHITVKVFNPLPANVENMVSSE